MMGWTRLVDLSKITFLLQKNEIRTDNAVFRLHYRFGVFMVSMFAIFYIMYGWSKRIISCITSGPCNKENFREAVNLHCWMYGTYLINAGADGQIYPGIGGRDFTTPERVSYNEYYKWMHIYIIIMFVLLRLPRHVWKSFENQRLQSLVGMLNSAIIVDKDEAVDRQKDILVDYLKTHIGYHGRYACGLVIGELLNVIVSTSLMWTWDYIAGFQLSTNGAANFNNIFTTRGLRNDSLARVFPLVAKCTFNAHGPGGGVQKLDFICMLPLNLMHERAAVFFWYLFMILAVLGACALVYRFFLICSKRLRCFVFSALTPLTSMEDIHVLTEKVSYSDWFLIYQIGSVIEPVIFREILQRLVLRLKLRSSKV